MTGRRSRIGASCRVATDRQYSFAKKIAKEIVREGAVSGGGLTVIANAPNPAGQAILKSQFDGGVSPAGLLKAALVPTAILFGIFMLLR